MHHLASLSRSSTVSRCLLTMLVALALIFAHGFAPPAWGAVGVLARNEDFKLLANQGFAQTINGASFGPNVGSYLNSYAWSMAWFNGSLFVGTGRFETDGSLQSLSTLRAEIWRYTPGGIAGASGTWQRVYQSPTTLFIIPRDIGYRWMTVCDVGGRSEE